MSVDVLISNMTLSDINSISSNFSSNFDEFWSIDTLKNDFSSENSKYIVAKIDTEIVGLAGIKIILDEANVMNIVTRIDKRNLGIGSSLLSYLIRAAENKNCHCITLEVNENNLSAIHLYEKYNFERIGLRKKYYNNTDNAIIMTRRITNEK